MGFSSPQFSIQLQRQMLRRSRQLLAAVAAVALLQMALLLPMTLLLPPALLHLKSRRRKSGRRSIMHKSQVPPESKSMQKETTRVVRAMMVLASAINDPDAALREELALVQFAVKEYLKQAIPKARASRAELLRHNREACREALLQSMTVPQLARYSEAHQDLRCQRLILERVRRGPTLTRPWRLWWP